MSQFNEVAEPIICDAYAEPTHHWVIEAREYLPDFLARLSEGWQGDKEGAARRWAAAVNAEGSQGR